MPLSASERKIPPSVAYELPTLDISGRCWRPEPESNRRIRICSPLRHHSAIGPYHFGSSRLLNEKRAERNALMRTGVHSAAAEQLPPMGNRSRAVSSCSGWNGLIST